MRTSKIDRIEPRETGEPELALVERGAAVEVVVGEDETRDQEEDVDEDEAVLNKGTKRAEVGRREVEENDIERQQGTDAGEGG